jgi:hypothetical protein
VIFFQFWLSLVVTVFVQKGIVKPSELISIGQLSVLIPSLLTSIEMVIASIWHLWAFDFQPYVSMEPIAFKSALWDSFYWLDLVYDIQFALDFFQTRYRPYHQLEEFE